MDVALLQKHLAREWPLGEVIAVDNEQLFRAALLQKDFDLILADYSLPGFEGLTALAMARELCPGIPFVFVSGAICEERAVECLKAGATDYVLKDRLVKLAPAIRRALKEAGECARREQIEKQLRRREEEYRDLLNSVDGIVWQADLFSLQFTFVSQQAERLLGYPVRRWLEEPEFWQRHIHPDDRERAVALCGELTVEKQHRSFEYRMLAADGRVVWLRDLVSIRTGEGAPPQIQGIMVNTTPRKQAEAARRESEARLERSNRDLLRRNQEIQNFYHTLSHELKTPLTSAREFVSIVMDGLAGPVTSQQSEYLGIAQDSCDHLRVCIDDLLDATRLETGKLALELKPVPLGPLLQRALMTFQPRAAEKKITLQAQIPPDLPDVPMDEVRITQVITNLLNNAIKYTPSEGTIVMKAGDAPASPELLEVSIADTGCGIRPEDQERIFDRLYQVKAGDATTEQGVGLGLYLSRELVQLHGGSIRVTSEVGKGSTFSFVLPRSRHFLHANVLVVEDDPDLLEMVRQILESERFNVRTARDGLEGLHEMRRQAPDIVMLDLAMPNLSGPAMLGEIRKDWGQIPVIVHTGFSDGELMKQALPFSPFTLLAKPCLAEQIVETVRRVQRSEDTTIWRKNHPGLHKPRN
jgi:PAS domain S-box-containing protein